MWSLTEDDRVHAGHAGVDEEEADDTSRSVKDGDEGDEQSREGSVDEEEESGRDDRKEGGRDESEDTARRSKEGRHEQKLEKE
jgi:hypothetical protein